MTTSPAPSPEFGSRVAAARIALGLTRRQLATEADVGDHMLRNIEQGRCSASRVTATKILAAIAQRDPVKAQWVAQAGDAPLAG